MTSFLALTIIILSCTKELSEIGIGLLPDSDFVEIVSTDTITVKAYTMYDDSTITSNAAYMYSGSIYDAYFGTTEASFVTQLRIISEWPGSHVTVDSVFLNFTCSEVAGDTTGLHFFRLLETGTELNDSTDYYSNQDPDTIKYLGEYRLPVMKADSAYSVKLFKWVGEYLFRDTSMFNPPTDFYEDYFKGLYFGVWSEADPILLTFNTADNPLMITVYYTDTESKSRYYSFLATERAANYNRVVHDFSAAEPGKEIKHINDMVADTAVYLQSYNGVYARLDLPSFTSYAGTERIAVNKARLHVPVHLDGETFLEKDLPSQIYLRYRDSKGEQIVIPDMVHDVGFMDGTYYKETDSYVFNITTFMQQYIEGLIDYPSVEMFYGTTADKNVIFQANDNDPTIRFEFAFTRY